MNYENIDGYNNSTDAPASALTMVSGDDKVDNICYSFIFKQNLKCFQHVLIFLAQS